MKFRLIHCAFLSFICSTMFAQNFKIQMHSHNDYEQEFPLSKALSNDFKSIEVDIFEYEGRIVVCHDDDDLHLQPTLADLYLEPLSNYNFKNDQSIFLLIDLKMEGHKILDVLHNLLEAYAPLFKNRNHPSQYAPVQIILSGSVDKEYVFSNTAFSYFFIDGRVSDLSYNHDSNVMPLISSDLVDLFYWNRRKKITRSALEPILQVINEAHKQGKIIRFWNTPEKSELWDLLVAMKVDLIGVDDIDKFVLYSSKFNR